MCSQKWSCHTSFDSAMDLSGDELTSQEEYIKIEVRNPRTHINKTKALYTDYEIHVQTNNIAFSKSDSCVRRRYSDFQWLHRRLSTQFFLERSLPELPPKRLFGRFKRQFLKYRKRGLQKFLENIAKESVYLSDISVHLFLQTDLPVKEIESRLGGTESCGELVDVLQSGRCFKNGKLTCDTLDDENCDCEGDSGFSYSSTTVSITDITSTQAPTYENYKLFNTKKCYDKSLQFQKSRLTDNMQYEILQKTGHLPSESNLTSEDDISIDYDADNEVDETQENNNNIPLLDNDELFLFKKNLGKEYTLERAFELIQKRSKPSERFFAPDLDSDDCFDVSEYDIIDSDNEVSFFNNCFERLSKSHLSMKSNNRPANSARNILNEKDGPQLKNKFIIAKVRSLPKLRFPMKHVERNKIVGRNLVSDRSRVNTLKPSSTSDDLIFAKVSDDDDISILKIPQVNSAQLSSDDDYLTTIHTIASKDSPLDTQSGDVPPSQVYNYIKRRKKRAKGLTSLILNFKDKQCGRFSVSAVNPFMSNLIECNGKKINCNEKTNSLGNEFHQRISTATYNFSYPHLAKTCPKDALYQQSTLCSYNTKDSQLLQTYDIL